MEQVILVGMIEPAALKARRLLIATTNYACGVPSDNGVIRHVFGDDGAGGDNCAVSYSHSWQNYRARSDPNIVAYDYFLSRWTLLLYHRRIDSRIAMRRRNDYRVGAHHHVMPDCYGSVKAAIDADSGAVPQTNLGPSPKKRTMLHVDMAASVS